MPVAEVAASARVPTTIALLEEAAGRWPDREAIAFAGRRVSYADYRARANAAAATLRAAGAGPGARVATVLPNGIDACVVTFGVHRAGAALVPLNPLYTDRELAQVLADARPAALVCDPARAEALRALVGTLPGCVLLPADAVAGTVDGPAAGGVDAGPGPGPDDVAFVQYTGGTSGRAKGVLLAHRAVVANVLQREALLPTGRDGERVLCAMPLFHSYALAMGLYLAVLCGGTLVVLPRYHPQAVLDAVRDERVTIFPGSPTIFTGLMGHPTFAATDWSRVHTCYSGSAPLPAQVLERWEHAVGAPILEGYGQTEAGPVLTFNPARGVRKPGTVGVPVPDTEVQIVEVERGEAVLPRGEIGEVRARGPQLMRGYLNLPQETAQALRDGWLYTGDLGCIDADGYLSIRDRKKDMAIVGGYNVYPREVEEVLFSHPSVSDCAAAGVPDAYRGEVIEAWVVPADAAAFDPDALAAHCEANLARYKRPVRTHVVERLPKTGANKTDKRALVRTRVDELARSIGAPQG
jgi:long-chain acyl-CoA synthetase